jgi:hypothetical protein
MYNKIFTKILDSSIWLEPKSTRIVWITFLAAMDEEGFVQFASIRNVAHRANVSIEEAQSAVASLEGPDPDSGDPHEDGRRIEKVEGGWTVLNADKHRKIATREHQKALNRERVKRHRSSKCNAPVMEANETVTPSEAEAEAEAKAEHLEAGDPSGSDAPAEKPKKSKARPKQTDTEWLASLKGGAAYAGIDIEREHAKMHRWCETNGKTATRRRFVAWLNRIDPPMKPQRGEFSDAF